MVSEAMAVLSGEISQDRAEELMEAFMLEDVIYVQKLKAEISEAEVEIGKVTAKDAVNGNTDKLMNGCKELVNEEEENEHRLEGSKECRTRKRPTAVSLTFYE